MHIFWLLKTSGLFYLCMIISLMKGNVGLSKNILYPSNTTLFKEEFGSHYILIENTFIDKSGL